MGDSFVVEEIYMKRAIQLARLGMGHVSPNPMVGCVIVHNGKVIGEGYHRKCGEAHAEVNAISAVVDRKLLSESTLYVTLEPCSHFGKTPPCSDLIIRHAIPRVVIGTVDPFAEVAGRGIKKLQAAGCEVVVDVMGEACVELNRRFFTFHQKKRPYIILKWAQTLDGFIDIERTPENYGQPTWITNALSKTAVHKMRTDEDAILVGTTTARKDDPSLNVREWCGDSPLRLVIDRKLHLSKDLKVFDRQVPTLVFTEEPGGDSPNLSYQQIRFDGSEVEQILAELHRRNIQSLIVEGGKKLLNSFIQRGLWDESRLFIGNRFFKAGVAAPVVKGKLVKHEELNDSQLLIFRNE